MKKIFIVINNNYYKKSTCHLKHYKGLQDVSRVALEKQAALLYY